ncbi:MAG: hypothetical protein WBG66_05325, partial [Geitlerinemataceae cyanobacterium]
HLASRQILGAQIELNSKGLEIMHAQLLWRFRQLIRICLPMASLVLATSVWAGYNPPPEQDSPKDPTGSTSLILDRGDW